jgi:hypothetical protein
VKRLAILALLALVVAGSASAGNGKREVFHVVARHGDLTATLTYTRRGPYAFSDVWVSIRRKGSPYPLLGGHLCQVAAIGMSSCTWGAQPAFGFGDVTGHRSSVVVGLYTGGNTCCAQTFVGLLGRNPHWIEHTFGFFGDGGRRIHGRYYFVSIDYRFYCALASCAGSTEPIRAWAIRRGRFEVATRSLRGLVRSQVQGFNGELLRERRERHQAPQGTLAAWCADQYLLHQGERCSKELAFDLAHGDLTGADGQMNGGAFIRTLNRDLKRWGYKR